MRRCLVALLIFLPMSLWAIAPYEFSKDEYRQRYHKLAEQFRCPMCKNQNVVASDADIAGVIRDKVHELLEAGKSDEEIIDFMVQRYGYYVTYRPPVNSDTLFLWLLPVVLLLIGFAVVYKFISKKQDMTAHLSEDEKRKLAEILNKGDH